MCDVCKKDSQEMKLLPKLKFYYYYFDMDLCNQILPFLLEIGCCKNMNAQSMIMSAH